MECCLHPGVDVPVRIVPALRLEIVQMKEGDSNFSQRPHLDDLMSKPYDTVLQTSDQRHHVFTLECLFLQFSKHVPFFAG